MGATRSDKSGEGVFEYSVAYFLIALVLMLATVPLVDEFIAGELIESILITIVLLSAVVAVGGKRRSLAIGLMLVAPAVAAKWLEHAWPQYVPRQVSQISAMLFLSYVTFRLLHYILSAPQVDSEVICAAIAVYLIVGLIWAFAYILVASLNPHAFSSSNPNEQMVRFQALYFSFITLTTTGYGDIVPVSKIARLLAMTEAVAGMFYTTILIARLVALYAGSRKESSERSEGP
jgi:hypothetical protein